MGCVLFVLLVFDLPQFPPHGSDLLVSGNNEEFLSCTDEDPWLLNPVATWPVLSRLDPEGWGVLLGHGTPTSPSTALFSAQGGVRTGRVTRRDSEQKGSRPVSQN